MWFHCIIVLENFWSRGLCACKLLLSDNKEIIINWQRERAVFDGIMSILISLAAFRDNLRFNQCDIYICSVLDWMLIKKFLCYRKFMSFYQYTSLKKVIKSEKNPQFQNAASLICAINNQPRLNFFHFIIHILRLSFHSINFPPSYRNVPSSYEHFLSLRKSHLARW